MQIKLIPLSLPDYQHRCTIDAESEVQARLIVNAASRCLSGMDIGYDVLGHGDIQSITPVDALGGLRNSPDHRCGGMLLVLTQAHDSAYLSHTQLLIRPALPGSLARPELRVDYLNSQPVNQVANVPVAQPVANLLPAANHYARFTPDQQQHADVSLVLKAPGKSSPDGTVQTDARAIIELLSSITDNDTSLSIKILVSRFDVDYAQKLLLAVAGNSETDYKGSVVTCSNSQQMLRNLHTSKLAVFIRDDRYADALYCDTPVALLPSKPLHFQPPVEHALNDILISASPSASTLLFSGQCANPVVSDSVIADSVGPGTIVTAQRQYLEQRIAGGLSTGKIIRSNISSLGDFLCRWLGANSELPALRLQQALQTDLSTDVNEQVLLYPQTADISSNLRASRRWHKLQRKTRKLIHSPHRFFKDSRWWTAVATPPDNRQSGRNQKVEHS